MDELETGLQNNYVRDNDLTAIIETALKESGLDLNHLIPEDLAPLDELHIGGRKATLQLLERVQFHPGDHVLDIGCGLGGPSRAVANAFGCRVTGIDLMAEYCSIATLLSRYVSMQDRVSYRQANALELPFDDESFEGVWSQHMVMNIDNKEKLLHEISRVLKAGGKWILYENFSGPAGPPYLPVPWADDESINFLISTEEMHALLAQFGFTIDQWHDVTAESTAWFESSGGRDPRRQSSKLEPSLLFGPGIKTRGQNVFRSLKENRLRVIQAVVHQ